jgi:hypothetical protein
LSNDANLVFGNIAPAGIAAFVLVYRPRKKSNRISKQRPTPPARTQAPASDSAQPHPYMLRTDELNPDHRTVVGLVNEDSSAFDFDGSRNRRIGNLEIRDQNLAIVISLDGECQEHV